jgi:membrane-bound serine protease (ClpP class)
LTAKSIRFVLALVALLTLGGVRLPRSLAETRPLVVEVQLDMMIHHVSAEYVRRGIRFANQRNADAVLLTLNTPGGLQGSMREIIEAVLDSRVPVITYVGPSGGSAASAGFFILLAGDVAVMAPGTNAGAAHPVVLGGAEIGKTMEAKLENDAAAYIRAIATKRGRNAALADDAVRKSSSYTDKEALDGNLIDAIASTPNDIFAKFDGKTIKRFNNTTTVLHLANAEIEPFTMGKLEMFFAWLADPNIAFILGALGLACLYIEFTHPGLVAPGVVGAVALVLAMYAFNLLPINSMGVLLILLAIGLFILEAKVTAHGALAAGGILAMVLGALILVDSPWPQARIHLSTALGVTVPLAVITVLLMRLAWVAQKGKALAGAEGLIDSVGIAQTDVGAEGKVLILGEIWNARADGTIPKGAHVRVRKVEGLTLVVELTSESR